MPVNPPWLEEGASIAVVAAHPDDETLGFGGQLTTPLNVTFIYVTDGAPRNMIEARRFGFADPRQYADARRKELGNALRLTPLREIRIREIGIPDQEAAFHIARIAECLSEHLGEIRPDLILTHPFEGGHPDHDATAMAVQLAAPVSPGITPILEFTSYHLEGTNLVAGSFIDEQPNELSIRLTEQAYRIKQSMIECFTTQSGFIRQLLRPTERFRSAPQYEFTRRPHAGPLFYETWDSGMTWDQWLDCIRVLTRSSRSATE